MGERRGKKGDGKDSQMCEFVSISPVNQTPGLQWVTSSTQKQEKETKRDKDRKEEGGIQRETEIL